MSLERLAALAGSLSHFLLGQRCVTPVGGTVCTMPLTTLLALSDSRNATLATSSALIDCPGKVGQTRSQTGKIGGSGAKDPSGCGPVPLLDGVGWWRKGI